MSGHPVFGVPLFNRLRSSARSPATSCDGALGACLRRAALPAACLSADACSCTTVMTATRAVMGHKPVLMAWSHPNRENPHELHDQSAYGLSGSWWPLTGDLHHVCLQFFQTGNCAGLENLRRLFRLYRPLFVRDVHGFPITIYLLSDGCKKRCTRSGYSFPHLSHLWSTCLVRKAIRILVHCISPATSPCHWLLPAFRLAGAVPRNADIRW